MIDLLAQINNFDSVSKLTLIKVLVENKTPSVHRNLTIIELISHLYSLLYTCKRNHYYPQLNDQTSVLMGRNDDKTHLKTHLKITENNPQSALWRWPDVVIETSSSSSSSVCVWSAVEQAHFATYWTHTHTHTPLILTQTDTSTWQRKKSNPFFILLCFKIFLFKYMYLDSSLKKYSYFMFYF